MRGPLRCRRRKSSVRPCPPAWRRSSWPAWTRRRKNVPRPPSISGAAWRTSRSPRRGPPNGRSSGGVSIFQSSPGAPVMAIPPARYGCRGKDDGLPGLQSGPRGVAPGALLRHELVGDEVLINVAHVADGLAADALGGNLLDVAEPDVPVEAALLGLVPQLSHAGGTGVVRRKGEQAFVQLVHRLVLVVLVHHEARVLHPGVDVG